MSEKNQRIVVYIRAETLKQSIANDISSITLLTGLVWLNEITVQSSALSFLFGLVGIMFIINWSMSTSGGRNYISGNDPDDVANRVKEYLKSEVKGG